MQLAWGHPGYLRLEPALLGLTNRPKHSPTHCCCREEGVEGD